MKNYQHFEAEDFLQDDFFLEWALHPTAQSEQFWRDWLAENPHKKEMLEDARLLARQIRIRPVPESLTDDEVRLMIDHVRQHGFMETKQRHDLFRWLKVAATVLVFFTAGLLTYHYVFHKPSTAVTTHEEMVVNNPTTNAKLVRLADGSLAILHGHSSLRFPIRFNGAQRHVYLSGEAFFEVHKNPAKPFLVHSQHMITRVLGTSFTVRAYGDEKTFKVTVNTGKVLVYADQNKHQSSSSVTLLPNQEAKFQTHIQAFKKDTLRNPSLLSKEVAQQQLNFKDAPLSLIIDRLNKAYDIHIQYDKEKLGSQTLTASLSDLPLDQKVEFIAKAINARYSFENGNIQIMNQ